MQPARKSEPLPRLDPARSIIEMIGGEVKASEITAASVPTVYGWQYPKDKGGTGGTIPQKHHRAILGFARENQINLTAEDFLPVAEEV